MNDYNNLNQPSNEEWLNDENINENEVSEKCLALEKSLLDIKDRILNRNISTIKEKKIIMNMFTNIMNTNLQSDLFKDIKQEVLLESWKVFINFFNNLNKKNISDMIKIKSQYITENSLDVYLLNKDSIIDKSVVIRMTELLDFLSALCKLLDVAKHNFTNGEDFKDLISWIIDQVIGEDFTIFGDYVENFYDLNGKYSELYRYHYETMLNLILFNPQLLDRDLYDKLLESQYLILIEENITRFSNCYHISIKILGKVMPYRLLGKVHGIWEKLVVNAFKKYLMSSYTAKKIDDDFLFITQYLLEWSFVFDNDNYGPISRIIVDHIINHKRVNDSVINFLKRYLDFLPYDIEFQMSHNNDQFYIDDLLRLVKFLFVCIIESKDHNKFSIPEIYTFREYKQSSSDIKIKDYEYVNSSDGLNVLVDYIGTYFYFKESAQSMRKFDENEIFVDAKKRSYEQLENSRVKKDVINFLMPLLKHENSVCDLFEGLTEACRESINFEKIVPILSGLLLKHEVVSFTDFHIVKLINANKLVSLHQKYMFNCSVLVNVLNECSKNKDNSTVLKDLVDYLHAPFIEGFLLVNQNIPSLSYFAGLFLCLIHKEKELLSFEQRATIRSKIIELLKNIKSKGPTGSSLDVFNFWKSVCLFVPYIDNHMLDKANDIDESLIFEGFETISNGQFIPNDEYRQECSNPDALKNYEKSNGLTTFELILKNWLPYASLKSDTLSFSNFFYWGYSQDTELYDTYSSSKTPNLSPLCFSNSNVSQKKCNICKEDIDPMDFHGFSTITKDLSRLPFIKPKVFIKDEKNNFTWNFQANLKLNRRLGGAKPNSINSDPDIECCSKNNKKKNKSEAFVMHIGRGLFRSYKSLFYLIKYFYMMYSQRTQQPEFEWIRLLLYLCEDTKKASKSLHKYMINLLNSCLSSNKKLTSDSLIELIAKYDIFSVENLSQKYSITFNCMLENYPSKSLYNIFDNENGVMYLCQMFPKKDWQPFNQLTDDFDWGHFKRDYLQRFTYTCNNDTLDVFLDTFLKRVSIAFSNDKISTVNTIITSIKADINSEKCHDVATLKTYLLIVGKILASQVLMEGQSKNKTLKLWISIFDISYSALYQLGSLENFGCLFKRLDFKSQQSVLNNIYKTLIVKQDIQIQFEMLASLSKISVSLMVWCFQNVLSLIEEKTYNLFKLMISELCFWYKFETNKDLFAVLHYDFMKLIVPDILNTNIINAPIYVSLALNALLDNGNEFGIYKLCDELLRNEKLSRLFISTCLVMSKDLSKLKSLGIAELKSNDLIRATVLHSVLKNNNIEDVVDHQLLNQVEGNISDVCYNHIKFKEQLKILDTSSLATIATEVLQVCPDLNQSLVKEVLYEGKPISFLKLTTLKITDLVIAASDYKNEDSLFSSLMIEFPILEILFEVENELSIYDFSISAIRKMKILYLLVIGRCSKQSIIIRITINFLEYIIKVEHFEHLFGTFKSFLFVLISKVNFSHLSFELKLKILTKLYSVKNKLDITAQDIIVHFAAEKGKSALIFNLLAERIFKSNNIVDLNIQKDGDELIPLSTASAVCCIEDLNLFFTDLLLENGRCLLVKNILNFDFPSETLTVMNWEHLSSIFANKLIEEFKFEEQTTPTSIERNHIPLITENLDELRVNTKSITDLLKLVLVCLSLRFSREYEDADEDLEADFFDSICVLNLEFEFDQNLNKSDFGDLIEFTTIPNDFMFGVSDEDDKTSYLDWLHHIWSHITLHLPENSVFNYLWMIDKKFNSAHLKEKFLYAVIVCAYRIINKNAVYKWGDFFNSVLVYKPSKTKEFKTKALTLLKIFLLIRSLDYDKENNISKVQKSNGKKVYEAFDLEAFIEISMELKYYKLAFMLADEDKNTWNNKTLWKEVFEGLNSEYDIFLKTSIPMELELNDYLKHSREYSKDFRFSQSVLGFNLASVEANYNLDISLKNIQQSFKNQGEYYLADNLNPNEAKDFDSFNENFDDCYHELQNWDIPLSNIHEERCSIFNYRKTMLLHENDDTDSFDFYGCNLIKSLMIGNNKNIKEQILGLNDTRLNMLSMISMEEINSVKNNFKMSHTSSLSLIPNTECSNLYSKVNCTLRALQDSMSELSAKNQYGMLKYFNELAKIQVYSSVFMNNLTSKSRAEKSTQEVINLKASTKSLLNTLGVLHLVNLSFVIEKHGLQTFETYNLPLKELILAQKFIEMADNYNFDPNHDWLTFVNLQNLTCRWNSGDKTSSYYHLNNMISNDAEHDDIVKNILYLHKIKWTLESNKETLQNTWNLYYKLFQQQRLAKKVDDSMFLYHSKDIYSINSHYYDILISKMDNYNPDYTEMNTLIKKHDEIRKQIQHCKGYLTLHNHDPVMKRKVQETLKVVLNNEKFVSERCSEIRRSLRTSRIEIVEMTVCLLSILSSQICASGKHGYKETETIDMFFSLWFELINFFSKDYFDIDSTGKAELKKLQIKNLAVNFKHVLVFETIPEMLANKDDGEDDWIRNRYVKVEWKNTLQNWVDSIEFILENNIEACLPWLGTIFAKISTGHIEVNENCNVFFVLMECYLNKIITSCINEFPEYSIHLANSYMNYSSENNEKAKLRSFLISQLITYSAKKDPKLMQLVDNYKSFSDVIKDLSLSSALKKVSKISLEEKQNCKVIFQKSPEEIFEVFSEKRNILNPLVDYVDLMRTGNDLSSYNIVGIDKTINLSTSGLSRPRIFSFQMKNGTRFKVLAKGNDDLKPDEIMLKVMKKIDKLIFRKKNGTNLKYRLITYQVFPMGHNFGLMEFIKNVSSLNDILKPMHQGDEISHSELRKKMDASYKANNMVELRVKEFNEMCKLVTPRFNEFFRINFLSPESWYKAKKTYAMSLAITSMICHILGIGDRHMSNVMMNCQTGDLVHIDFGITFDGGKKLVIPEKIPFRYTADMRDALGIYGHYGAINRFFEDVYSSLRKDKLVVTLSLRNVKLDPLYKWSLEVSTKKLEAMFDSTDSQDSDESDAFCDSDEDSCYSEYWDEPMKKKLVKELPMGKFSEYFDVVSNQSNEKESILFVKRKSKIAYNITEDYSKKCLDTVSDKLLGGKERQSVESCVQSLMNEAQSSDNLAVVFCGWCPFY